MVYSNLSPRSPRLGDGFTERSRQLACCSGGSSFLVRNKGGGTQTRLSVLAGESLC